MDRPTRIALLAAAVTVAVAPALAATGDPGTPDPSFGSGGFAFSTTTNFGNGLALDAQGRIVVAGETANSTPAVQRFTPAGAVDTSFGPAETDPGTVILDVGAIAAANDVAALSDGAYAVTLEQFSTRATVPFDADLVRLTPDGALDTGFDGDGAVAASFSLGAIGPAPGGGVFAAGEVGGQIKVAEYSPAGTLVAGFGDAGVATSASLSGAMTVTDIAIEPGGSILVSATRLDSAYSAAVARFAPAGLPDTSFGGDGIAEIGQVGSCQSYISPVAIAVDGQRRVVVGIYSYDNSTSDFKLCHALKRLGSDGALDAAYTGSLGDPPVAVNDLVLQPDGSALAVGTLDPDGAVVALDTAGGPDTSFAPGPQRPGFRALQAGPTGTTDLRGAALLADGRLIVGGTATGADDANHLIAGRLFADAAPVAGLSGPDSAAPGQTVVFTSTSTDDGPLLYDWDLDGNGSFETTTGSTPTAAHSYPIAGLRTVRLRVTDAKTRIAVAEHAIRIVAPAPADSSTPAPGPTATATPAPTTEPSPTPTPEEGVAVVAGASEGTVRVRLPGRPGFQLLGPDAKLPLGTEFDTRNGHVAIAADNNGKVETVEFWDGFFTSAQPAGSGPVLSATLTRGSFKSCKRRKTKKARASASKKPIRRLWGSGKGHFRTKGRYSAATVRGTRWLVEDRCTGTLTRVASGVVSVRDTRRHRTVSVRRGRSYLAKAP